MRVFISGVLGAVVSAAAWLGVEHFRQTNYGWMVCLIGLITGIIVHKASKAGTGGGFARGALAVVLTLAAIAGGQEVYARILQSGSPAAGAVIVESLKGGVDSSKTKNDDADGSDAPAIVLTELEPGPLGVGPNSYSKSAMKKNLSDWDMIWMGIAALAAYVTGKGGDTVAAEFATEEPREDADEPQESTEPDKDGE